MNRRRVLGSLLATMSSHLPFVGARITRNKEGGSEQGARVRKFFLPPYPNLMRQTLIKGKASVTVHILANGTVASVEDFEGPTPLCGHVADFVMRWEFDVPQKEDTTLRLTFNFRLEGPIKENCAESQLSGTLPDYFEIVTNPPQTTFP